MDAVAELALLDLAAEVRGHLDARLHGQTLHALLLALGSCRGELGDLVVRNGDARHVLVHVLGHAGRLQRDDAGHDVHLDVGLGDLIHEGLQRLDGKDALGLDILRARIHLLLQLVDLQEDGLIHGSDGRALVEVGRGGQIVAATVLAGGFHPGEHLQDAHGIQIEHGLGGLAVAHGGVVAGQSQHGVDAERRCGEHVAHDRHAGAIAAGHLNDGLQAVLLQRDAEAQRGRLQGRGLHVRHVHAVHNALQALCDLHFLGKIVALRGGHLSGDTKNATFQGLFKYAHCFALLYFTSTLRGQLLPS